MKKKILGIVLGIALMLGTAAAVSAGVDFAQIERAEQLNMIENNYQNRAENWVNAKIQMYLNTDFMYINDVQTMCEKPYLSDGNTLVPLRTVGEAFGADISWNGENREITVTYLNSTIKMSIGSTVAETDGIAEIMPAAPEISENGVTMIPLRFIAEKFGAEVDFDGETGGIYVGMSRFVNNIVTDSVKNEKIGDSYWNWTIDNGDDFEIYANDMDYVCLMGNGGRIYITAENRASSPKRDMQEILAYYSEFAYHNSAPDSKTGLGESVVSVNDDGYDYLDLTINKQANRFEIRKIYTDDTVYGIYYSIYNDVTDKYLEKYKSIIDSFTVGYDQTKDVYDTNTLDEMGCYKFSNAEFNISCKIPVRFTEYYDDTEILFINLNGEYTDSEIKMTVYPKKNGYDALSAAKYDLAMQKKVLDEENSVFSSVLPYNESRYNAYYFTQSYNGGTAYDFDRKDIYIESGEYVYNINVKMAKNQDSRLLDYIVNSFEFGEIELSEGQAMTEKQVLSVDDTKKAYTDEFETTIPKEWEWIDYKSNTLSIMDYDNEATITINLTEKNDSPQSIMRSYLNHLELKGAKLTEDITDVRLGRYSGCKAVISGNGTYLTVYRLDAGDKMLEVIIMTNELFYNNRYINYAENVIRNINLK